MSRKDGRRLLWCGLGAGLFASFAGATFARADDSCGSAPIKSSYTPQPGDTDSNRRLSLTRPFSGTGRLELDVCSADVRIRPSQDGQLHLEVETGEPADLKLGSYLKTVAVSADRATINVQTPKKFHPAVYLDVPANAALHTQINLGSGELRFHANGYGGDRELNLGAGNAIIYADAERDYSRLQANVGIGSFHDHRPGGDTGHFTISKSLAGQGASSLEVNVGAGSLDLKEPE